VGLDDVGALVTEYTDELAQGKQVVEGRDVAA
jgi:hypothetical protein